MLHGSGRTSAAVCVVMCAIIPGVIVPDSSEAAMPCLAFAVLTDGGNPPPPERDLLAPLTDPYAPPSHAYEVADATPPEELIPVLQRALQTDPRFASGHSRWLAYKALCWSIPRAGGLERGTAFDLLIEGALQEPALTRVTCLKGLERVEPSLREEALLAIEPLATTEDSSVLAALANLVARLQTLTPAIDARLERIAFSPHQEPPAIRVAMNERTGGMPWISDRYSAILRHWAMEGRWLAGELRSDLDLLEGLDAEGKRAAAFTLLSLWAGERLLGEPEAVLVRSLDFVGDVYTTDKDAMPPELWVYAQPLRALLANSRSQKVRETAAGVFTSIAASRGDVSLIEITRQTIEDAPTPRAD